MEQRTLGRTGLKVSVLTFGCGAVGGLMTKGDPGDQERAVARALELGITYFDTAALYGSGASETNLGRILGKLQPSLNFGTKVRLAEQDYDRIGESVMASLDASLKRLGRDHVDLFQLHNRITDRTAGEGLSPERVIGEVAPAFDRLRKAGKIRFTGLTLLGDTGAMLRVVDSGAFDSGQVCYNALNPTAGPIGGKALPADYPAQDYQSLLERCAKAGMGTIGIRVMAGGALSGSTDRHPLSLQNVEPLGSAREFATDAARARRLAPMLAEGHAASLPELAMRFAIAHPALSTAQIGLANMEQLEAAAAAVAKGPLSAAGLARLAELQRSFAGESR